MSVPSSAGQHEATGIVEEVKKWATSWHTAWEHFWFTPSQPHTLALIRILAGSMLFYTHLVWSLQLLDFLGPNSWISGHASQTLNQGPAGWNYAWSHLWLSNSPVFIWTTHLFALCVFAALTVGLWTRTTSILSFLLVISYCHRLVGSLFGLDQVNAMLATYLMLGAAGDVWSVDRWWTNRQGRFQPIVPKAGTTIAIRLMQLHLCVIYLFGGITKMRGDDWWDGSAMWFALASYEYQSWDLAWLVKYPWFLALLAHLTLLWETFYVALVWNRLTRPIALGMAVAVHGGIALALGMKTFGLAMIFANMAFLRPEETAAIMHWFGERWGRLRSRS